MSAQEILSILNGIPHPFPAHIWVTAALAGLIALTLVWHRLGIWAWTLLVLAALSAFDAPLWAWITAGGLALMLNIAPLRRVFVSWPAMGVMKKLDLIPPISPSEMEALRSGTAWIDADLFSGRPDWEKLGNLPITALTADEQAFLKGPVEELCQMADDWKINQLRDLPEEMWAYMQKERFFGMIVPKEWGGLGFSAEAHSQVIKKLASRSLPVSVTVMVPNSLGPAELILHHGTDAQRKHYLPRLARGEEIPCFALTEPQAGSDAGGILSTGLVYKKSDGSLGLRLNWEKRYITLASRATLLGLAVKVKDPENLLGLGTDPGTTCVLVDTKLPGVDTKRRHDPLGVPFLNCPTTGKNVEVGIDEVIGGVHGVGKGWAMLMACLAAGRGISLPATAGGTAALVARVVGDYTAVRTQFGLNIGKLEGLHEPMGIIGGTTWLLEAARRVTTGGIDAGFKPPVITAIAKYHFTEASRRVINHGMDILGGAAISRGPRNLFAHSYTGTPIIITVEGANIMTRTLIHFGQGLFRCHPWAFPLVDALASHNVKAFDRALWGETRHVLSNALRAKVLLVTGGWPSGSLGFSAVARARRRLTRVSALFAIMADMALVLEGGGLKRKGMLSGRYGDVLSWLYLGVCALARYEKDGHRGGHGIFFKWSLETALWECQKAMMGIFQNMGSLPVRLTLGTLGTCGLQLFPLGRPPKDSVLSKIAVALQTPGGVRDDVSEGMYLPTDKNDALGRLEHAFALAQAVAPLDRKARKAGIRGLLATGGPGNLDKALNVLSPAEIETVKAYHAARRDVVEVDSFDLDTIKKIYTPEWAGK